MVRRWELSYDWWKCSAEVEARHPSLEFISYTPIGKEYDFGRRYLQSRVYGMINGWYRAFQCVQLWIWKIQLHNTVKSTIPISLFILVVLSYDFCCSLLFLELHIIWLLLLYLVFWMLCNDFHMICCFHWCESLEPKVFRNHPLPPQGKDKVCVLTLSRLHLWDYITYVVVRRSRAMRSFSLTSLRTWSWLISHNKELTTTGLREKNLFNSCWKVMTGLQIHLILKI